MADKEEEIRRTFCATRRPQRWRSWPSWPPLEYPFRTPRAAETPQGVRTPGPRQPLYGAFMAARHQMPKGTRPLAPAQAGPSRDCIPLVPLATAAQVLPGDALLQADGTSHVPPGFGRLSTASSKGYEYNPLSYIGDASPPTWAVQLRRPCALAGRPVP
jgi:hypothetical protein